MAIRIKIELSGALAGIDGLGEKLRALRAAIVRWAQIGLERLVLPRLRAAIPVRTGRLRDARRFNRIPGGGRFYWDETGFYWRHQPGLPEGQIQIIEDALPGLITWALRRARQEVGI